MKAGSHNFAGVIMAGGKASRFGMLGQILPKCLFPVGHQTLLTRLVEQLRCGGACRIAVGCSPENILIIRPFVEMYRAAAGIPCDELETISCAHCTGGLLPALADVLSATSASRYLVCLGDIFYAQERFGAMARAGSEDALWPACLLTGDGEAISDGLKTGFVKCEGEAVRAISYRTQDLATRGQFKQWTGAFLFDGALASDLQQHLGEYSQAPFEDWIQGLVNRGLRLRWIDGGSFINVNSPAEHRFLVGRQSDTQLI